MGTLEKYKLAVVGCGGIGSYLAEHLFILYSNNQLNSIESITLFDDDVVDTKNLKYQNFEDLDITDYKSDSLATRYSFLNRVERVTNPETLNDYDIIIAAVDNSQFRKLLYDWAATKKDKYWIDLRSEGRSIAYYTKNKINTLDKMYNTLVETSEEGTSCQLNFELEAGIIQQGNKIIATIGSQLLLNKLRGEYSSAEFRARI